MDIENKGKSFFSRIFKRSDKTKDNQERQIFRDEIEAKVDFLLEHVYDDKDLAVNFVNRFNSISMANGINPRKCF